MVYHTSKTIDDKRIYGRAVSGLMRMKMAKIDVFAYGQVLNEVAARIDIDVPDIEGVLARLMALAARTRPPVWGYAGMLLALVESGDILDLEGLLAEVTLWEYNPADANVFFNEWTKENVGREFF